MNEFSEKSGTAVEVFRTQNTNWIVTVSHKACIFLFVAGIVAIIVRWNRLPPEVPLWYAKSWGTERLADPIWLFLLPVGSLIWHFINTLIAIFITKEYLVFTQLLFITSIIISILSFVTLTKILLIVT